MIRMGTSKNEQLCCFDRALVGGRLFDGHGLARLGMSRCHVLAAAHTADGGRVVRACRARWLVVTDGIAHLAKTWTGTGSRAELRSEYHGANSPCQVVDNGACRAVQRDRTRWIGQISFSTSGGSIAARSSR